MRGRWAKSALLVVLVALMVSVSTVAAGCGGAESKVPQVILGFEGDLTGPASGAVKITYDGASDYFTMVKEKGLLPQVSVKFIAYDTRTDYGRIAGAHVWLIGQGAQMMVVPSSTDVEMNVSRYAADQVPAVCTTATEAISGNEWCYSLYETQEAQHRGLLQWIIASWDYSGKGRNPRVGALGLTGMSTTVAATSGMEQFLAANPGKIDWAGAKTAPVGTSTWVVEVKALADCDYIIPVTFGAAGATFIKEARSRGYKGVFLAGSMALPGYWDIVTSVVPASDLYECYHQHTCPWCEDCEFTTAWEAALVKYRSSYADAQMKLSGYSTGWAWGAWMADVVERAVETVGAANVDGKALLDALKATNTDMTTQGWGGVWQISAQRHIITHEVKTYKWSVDQQKWLPVSGWIPIGAA
ncbi:MAG: ABC transporter substrate-binding protein [Chloroflexi bacterium]|nr:ABC transporter substrate-binding protein [Chloroflexota bacterium]